MKFKLNLNFSIMAVSLDIFLKKLALWSLILNVDGMCHKSYNVSSVISMTCPSLG